MKGRSFAIEAPRKVKHFSKSNLKNSKYAFITLSSLLLHGQQRVVDDELSESHEEQITIVPPPIFVVRSGHESLTDVSGVGQTSPPDGFVVIVESVGLHPSKRHLRHAPVRIFVVVARSVERIVSGFVALESARISGLAERFAWRNGAHADASRISLTGRELETTKIKDEQRQ